jgi:hypothetical protein
MKAMLIAVVVSFVGAASAEAAPKSMPSGKFGAACKIGYNCYPKTYCYPSYCYPTYCPPVYTYCPPVYPVVDPCLYTQTHFYAPLQCEIYYVPTYSAWCYQHPVHKNYIPLRGVNGLPAIR